VNIDTPLRVLLAQRTSSSSSFSTTTTAAAAAAVQTCTPNDTLLSVVRKFSSSRALRLVCVEQAGSSKIVGLVSLTDLFKCASELTMLLQQCCRH
jgi:CBS-domain-containing membrane protein